MLFSDLTLSRRLERAEGQASVEYAEARRRLFPDSGATWMESSGVYAVYDGVGSPITQTFGLGMFAGPSPALFETIERFFLDRGAPVLHEVSPFAGIPTLAMLCARGYTPIESSGVLYGPVERPASEPPDSIRVRVIEPAEAQLWSDISALGWGQEHPELREFLRNVGVIFAAREHTLCCLAELDGRPGAAGVVCLHDRVALFAGSSTVPEMRRRGLQTALLQERMRYACDHGCDLAMMVAEPGSESQRNAERRGFRIAYTRIKWRLTT